MSEGRKRGERGARETRKEVRRGVVRKGVSIPLFLVIHFKISIFNFFADTREHR